MTGAGAAIGAPVTGLATLRLPRRSTPVLTLAVFAAGHVIAALSSSFTGVCWLVLDELHGASRTGAYERGLGCQPDDGVVARPYRAT
ncbi:MFS family permease [Streptomyces africanus]|uniref:MFS family permease n=1 Tax=Streptomyces africanus TaxID=231024 RepID=A0ABU0QWT9_9ACTN|nr:hypothetical protein [Streptomyces africanus]MDQ0751869.1 MFS family permease [Streptomyces africanus]